MHGWGPKASPSSFVLNPNSNSQESPQKHTHSLSHAHSSTIGSSPTFLSAFHFLASFLHHPSRMVPAKPVLLAVLSPFLLCLLSTTIELVQCSSENKVILSLKEFQWKHNGGPPSCLSHKSRRLKGATILEMKHRDYCSGKKITDWNKKLQRRLILDDVHVRSLQLRRFRKKVSVEESEIQIPLTSGVKFQTLNYIVTVELGGKNMSVIVDTGSDLTWVQCEPCKLCYNQPEPIFKPSSSPSYQSVLCNSSSCQSLVFATGNYGLCLGNPPTCNYAVTYGDGSYTRGDLGSENLNLGASPSVKDFVFGCGRDNRGLFGGASGLMGLAKSSLSVVSQTSSVFGGIFSYCLPSTETGASGSFVMGGDSSAYKNKTPISYTKMVPNQKLPTFYFLNLTRISVGGVALLEASCTNSANNKGGILIDSGTVITRLGPSIYKALKEEFLRQFSGYPRAPGFSILDTCFNLSGYEEVNIPTLTMHFEGDAEMKIDVTGIFYMVKTDASQVCLALASLAYDDEFCIIGNYQQKNQRVIYNTKDSELGFAGEPCSFE